MQRSAGRNKNFPSVVASEHAFNFPFIGKIQSNVALIATCLELPSGRKLTYGIQSKVSGKVNQNVRAYCGWFGTSGPHLQSVKRRKNGRLPSQITTGGFVGDTWARS